MNLKEREYVVSLNGVISDISSNGLINGVTSPINVGENVLMSNNGNRLFVSSLKSSSGTSAGDVFVYNYDTSTKNWTFYTSLFQYASNDVSDHEYSSGSYLLNFGKSLACSNDGSILFVGMSGYRTTSISHGGFCVFNYINGSWNFLSKYVHGISQNNYMGYTLACSEDGSRVFTGTNATTYVASDVYKYDFNVSSGDYERDNTFSIKPSNSIANSNFGTSLDCDDNGTVLLVGSSEYGIIYNGQTIYPGSAAVFKESGGSWYLVQEFFSDISDNLPTGAHIGNGSYIGYKVQISNDGSKIAFSTKLYKTVNYHPRYGVVYIFTINNSQIYDYTDILVSPDTNTSSSNFFGADIAISSNGNHLIASVTNKQIYYYYDNSSNWIQNQSVNQNIYNYLASDTNVDFDTNAALSNFGNSLSMSSDGVHIAIGIPSYRYEDPTNSSSRYIGQAIALRGKIYQTINFSDLTIDYDVTHTLNASSNSGTSPSYSVTNPSSNNVYSLSGSNVTITGIGSEPLTATFPGNDDYLETTSEAIIMGTPVGQIIDYAEAISTQGTIGIGQKSGLIYSVLNAASLNLSRLTATIDISGNSVIWDPIGGEFEGIQQGITTVTLSQSGDAYHLPAVSVVLTYNVQSSWSSSYPSNYNQSYIPSQTGLSLTNQTSETLVKSIEDPASIANMILLGHSERSLGDNMKIFSIPFTSEEEKNEFGRTSIKRDNSSFSFEIKDISNANIDYLHIAVGSLDTLSDYTSMSSSDSELLNSLQNATDIMKIEQYIESNGEYTKQSGEYIQIRLYHPYDSLVLYHIDDSEVVTEINSENYPESSIYRETDSSDYWRALVPFSGVVGGTSSGGSNINGEICFPPYTKITCDQGRTRIDSIDTKYHTIRGEEIKMITCIKNKRNLIVEIDKNSFGENIPSKKTHISLNHRLFVNSKFLKAKQLIELYPRCCRYIFYDELLYNVLMEKHTIMDVNNLVVETLDPKHEFAKGFQYIEKNNVSKKNIQRLFFRQNKH